MKLSEAIALMERKDRKGYGIPFQITFIKCSISSNTGGDVMHINKAILAKNATFINSALRGQNRKRTQTLPTRSQVRNIISLDDNGYYKAHIRLITHINNLPIQWN